MTIKFSNEKCCHGTKCKKANVLVLYISTLDSINVGVVWGMVILIGGVVIKGYLCGLSLKQFWKSWSLCYCITITTGH